MREDQVAERPDVAIRTRAARIVDALGNAVAVEDRDLFPKWEIFEVQERPRTACVRMVKIRSRDALIKREWATPRINPPQRSGRAAAEELSSVTTGIVGLAMTLFSFALNRMSGAKRRLGSCREAFRPQVSSLSYYCL